MPSSLVHGKHVYIRCQSALTSNMTTIQEELNALVRLGVTGPRLDPNPSTIEPTRGGARNFTPIDSYCTKILAANFTKIQLGLYYGAVGTSWVTTDPKAPKSSDNTFLKNLYFALLDRLVANGISLANITAQLWNEWDGSVGGGDGTNANADVIQWLQYFAPLLKASYPSLRVIGPSFASSVGMNGTNVSAGFKTNVSANYPDSYCWSFYPSGSNMAVPYSSWEFAQKCYGDLDSNIATIESLDSGSVGLNMHVSESGLNQSRLGFTTSSFMKRGGLALESEYDMQMLSAMLNHPRIATVSWYMASNAAGTDGRTSSTNYGILDNASLKPFKQRYLAIGRVMGNVMDEATELAYWGSWAPEPS